MAYVNHIQTYSTHVKTIPEAFTFVMEYLDSATEPNIEILPCWYEEDDGDGFELWYEVTVSWSEKTVKDEVEEVQP